METIEKSFQRVLDCDDVSQIELTHASPPPTHMFIFLVRLRDCSCLMLELGLGSSAPDLGNLGSGVTLARYRVAARWRICAAAARGVGGRGAAAAAQLDKTQQFPIFRREGVISSKGCSQNLGLLGPQRPVGREFEPWSDYF